VRSKYNSLKAGARYDASRAIQERGISDITERTLGSVTLKFESGRYEAKQEFNVIGDAI
jgi:hypothetical protein